MANVTRGQAPRAAIGVVDKEGSVIGWVRTGIRIGIPRGLVNGVGVANVVGEVTRLSGVTLCKWTWR